MRLWGDYIYQTTSDDFHSPPFFPHLSIHFIYLVILLIARSTTQVREAECHAIWGPDLVRMLKLIRRECYSIVE